MNNDIMHNDGISSDGLIPERDDGIRTELANDIDIILISDMSNRCRNALLRNGIRTLNELRDCYNSGKIYSLRNVGNGTLNEVKRILETDVLTRIPKRITLNIYFPPKTFSAFLKYCNGRNVYYIDELSSISDDELLLIPGCDLRKVEEIKSIIQKLKQTKLIQNEICLNTNNDILNSVENKQPSASIMFIDIIDQLLDARISTLCYLGLSSECVEKLNAKGFNRISDLQNIAERRLATIVGANWIPNFRVIEKTLQLPLRDTVVLFFNNQLTTVEFQILIARANGVSVNKLAVKYKVVSARISELERKYMRVLTDLLGPLILPFFQTKGFVNNQDLKDIYDNEEIIQVMEYWMVYSGKYQKLKFANIFVSNEVNAANSYYRLYDIADDVIGDAADITACEKEIRERLSSSGYSFIDIDSFVDFLVYIGYTKHKCFVTRKKVSYGYLCAKLIEKYYPSGFKLYDSKELNQLRCFAAEEFGDIGLPSLNKNLSATIAKYTFFRDKGVVVPIESVTLDPELLRKIKRRIDITPSVEVSCADLYYQFKNLLVQQSIINSPIFLWDVLKFNYKDKYDFSKREYIIKPNYKEKKPTPLYREEDVKSWVIEPVKKKTNVSRPSTNFEKGCQLYHRFYGIGKVINLTNEELEVEFEKYGVKKVDVEYCAKNNIIWKL